MASRIHAPASAAGSSQPQPKAAPSSLPRLVRIALVDDEQSAHLAIRETFASLAPDWRLESHLQPGPAVEHITQRPPDAMLMDLRMPGLSGAECVCKMKAALPLLPIVMFTVCSDTDDILGCLMAGAVGYLIKPVSPAELVGAVRQVLEGGWAFCRKAQAQLGRFVSGGTGGALSLGVFSPREQQVLAGLLQCCTNKEIAERLGIAEATVHVHLRRLYLKLGVHRREELVRQFLRHGESGT